MSNSIRHWITLLETTVNPMDQPAFRRWFANSVVVDPQGAPLVVFHGTLNHFPQFSLDHTGKNDEGYLGKGFYFGSPAWANVYAGKYLSDDQAKGANVLPVFLSLQNPLPLEAQYNGRREIDRAKVIRTTLKIPEAATAAEVTIAAKRLGYDGVIYNLKGDKEYVAFSPNQIKSAVGNVGRYSREDDRLNES